MGKETVEALVDGGKASAAPPLGPALGPLKVNIGQVISEINKKTGAFAGMKVPVKVVVDTETRAFDIFVGTPPVSGLLKKEMGIQLGAGVPNKQKVGNLAIEDAIKVAKMKMDSLSAKNLKAAVKTVIGAGNSMGVLFEGKSAVEINAEIDAGKYDAVFKSEKTDVSSDRRKHLAEQLAVVQKSLSADLARIMEAQKAKEEKAAAKEAPAAAGAAPAAGAPAGGKAAAPAGKAPAAKAPAKK